MASVTETTSDLPTEFFKRRIIFLTGEVNDALAQKVIMQLLMLDSESSDDITMYINSPGGSVASGLAIYDTMQHVKSDVSTIGVGTAASMGAFLLMAGAPTKRFVLPNAQVLIHQPLGGVSGQATDIQIVADRIIETRNRLNELIAKHTGQTLKRIKADTDRDRWMWAEEAVSYGIADAIKYPSELQ